MIAAYLPAEVLIAYWSKATPLSLLVTCFASVSSAVVASRQIMHTSGVMLALGLVPAAALVGLGVVAGNLSIAGGALLRRAIEVGIIIAASVCVFTWKRALVQQRKMLS